MPNRSSYAVLRRIILGVAIMLSATVSPAKADFIEYVQTTQGSSVFWDQIIYAAYFDALISQIYSGPFDDPYAAAFYFDNSPITGNTFELFPSWIVNFNGISSYNSITGMATVTHVPPYPISVTDMSTYAASGVISAPGGGVIQGTLGTPVPIVMTFTMSAFFEDVPYYTYLEDVYLTIDSNDPVILQGTLTVTPTTISYEFPQQTFELNAALSVTIGASGTYVTNVPEASSLLLCGCLGLVSGTAFAVRRRRSNQKASSVMG